MLDQSKRMNHTQLMSVGQSQSQQVMNNQNSQMMINQLNNQNSQMMMMVNQSQSQSQRGGYVMWPQNTKPSGYMMNQSQSRSNKNRRNTTSFGGYNHTHNQSVVTESHQQNRLKPKRYISKKKFSMSKSASAPFAPRNTTSFLIRAKKAGGITSLVSPCPVTPAVLPTPIFSPSREVLVDMAKEEWGVDGYGSMKGLIRLRSPGNDDEEGWSSESDVEEHEHGHLEVEKRLDHDLSRFEMVYPNHGCSDHNSYLLENRVDDQDTHIARLEEDNLLLKERLFLMERDVTNLRTRLQCLETQRQGAGAGARGFVEEVVENGSENESGSRGYGRSENSEVFEENKNNVGNQESDTGDVHMKDGIQKSKEKTDDDHVNGIAVNGEKGLQGLEVLKGVDVAADVHMEDGIQKIEEKTDVVEAIKIEDDDDVNEGAANGDSLN